MVLEIVVVQLLAVQEIESLRLLHDHVLDGMGACRLGVTVALIFVDQSGNLIEVAVQLTLDHHRLHMVDQNRLAPSLRDGALRRIVCVIDVEVRHAVDADVRQAGR